jgi:hypothetical protein
MLAAAGIIAIFSVAYATPWAGSTTVLSRVVLATATGGALGWLLGRRFNEEPETTAIGGGAVGMLIALIVW